MRITYSQRLLLVVELDPMFSDVHSLYSIYRVIWNPNKAGEYVQVLENDPNNTIMKSIPF